MEYLVEAFRALGNSERLRLFSLIGQQGGSFCVCELVEALGLPQYQVSKHLRTLRRVGLIESARMGRWTYYSVASSQRAREISGFLRSIVPLSALAAEFNRLQSSLSRRVDGHCVVRGQSRPREGGDVCPFNRNR